MDDYCGDQIENDAVLAAALEAAERANATNAILSSGSLPNASSSAAAAAAAAAVPGQASGKPSIKQPVPQKIGRGSSSSIIVNTRQKGNPILTYVKNVPWEYGDIVPDYVVGQTTCALFLSLKYHRLHPEYIYSRIKALGNNYNLRVLLVMVDIDNHTDPLRELSKTSLINDLTLILAWTAPEAGRYLESYKSFEYTPPTLIQEKQSNDFTSRMVEVLTQIRSVNKVDAVSLVSTFGSVRAAINASPDEILMISGWGQRKVERFEKAVREGFRVQKAKKSTSSSANTVRRQNSTSANVAAKLGIGTLSLTPGDIASSNTTVQPGLGAPPADWVIEDDEDALIAVAEMEAEEERKRNKGKQADRPRSVDADDNLGAGVGAGVMDALAKLRERGS